jgi:hypothetical protein
MIINNENIFQMKMKFMLISLIICIGGFSQTMKFTQLSERMLNNNNYEYVYKVELYNDNNIPICIPVSLSFGFVANLDDTIEVSNIYPASDSTLTFSLYYTKSDIEGSSTRYPATPIVLNPGTYLLTNVRFEKTKVKKIFLELKYAEDKNFEYNKIWSSYENNPRYKWMDDLNFVDKKFPIL